MLAWGLRGSPLAAADACRCKECRPRILAEREPSELSPEAVARCSLCPAARMEWRWSRRSIARRCGRSACPGWKSRRSGATGAARGSRPASASRRASRKGSASTETSTRAWGRASPRASHPGPTRDLSASPMASASVERASGTSPARARRCSRTRRASSATTCAATSTGWTCSTRAGTPAICACHRRRSRDASVPSACGASSAMWTSGSCGTSRRDRGAPRSKGGWWLAGRNRCRPATTAHDEHYCDFQTGFRCCAEAQAARQIAERPA
jgi:hypothetical protein